MTLIFIILLTVIIICLLSAPPKQASLSLEEELKLKDEYIKKIQKEMRAEFDEHRRIESERIEFEFEARRKELNNTILDLKAREASEKEHIQELISSYYNQEKLKIDQKLDEDKRIKQEEVQQLNNELNAELEKYRENCNQEREKIGQEIQTILSELQTQKELRDSINQQIKTTREMAEKLDFYRLNISDNDKEDIDTLKQIRGALNKKEGLDKAIYDVYVSKPAQEMVKRILSGGAPSGIYKITRLSTNEVYIGKSTNIKDRWIQHIKTAMNCGTIATSILHTTMRKDGIDQFTFEVIEEVPKDKLSEREKYWINFYDSKKFGMNEKDA